MKNLATQKENIYSVYRRQKLDNEVLEHENFVQGIWIYVLLGLLVLVLCYVIKSKKSVTKTVSKAEGLFAGYYFKQNPDFQKELEESFERLPINAVILLILQHLGRSKSEILDIMGFSDQAFRSLKSRINGAKKNSYPPNSN